MLKFGKVIIGQEREELISIIDSKIKTINPFCGDILWNERRSTLVKVRKCIVNKKSLDELFSFELETANNLLFS